MVPGIDSFEKFTLTGFFLDFCAEALIANMIASVKIRTFMLYKRQAVLKATKLRLVRNSLYLYKVGSEKNTLEPDCLFKKPQGFSLIIQTWNRGRAIIFDLPDIRIHFRKLLF
jgi:hypothetical protein